MGIESISKAGWGKGIELPADMEHQARNGKAEGFVGDLAKDLGKDYGIPFDRVTAAEIEHAHASLIGLAKNSQEATEKYRDSYPTPAQNSKTAMATEAKLFENVMVHLTQDRPDLLNAYFAKASDRQISDLTRAMVASQTEGGARSEHDLVGSLPHALDGAQWTRFVRALQSPGNMSLLQDVENSIGRSLGAEAGGIPRGMKAMAHRTMVAGMEAKVAGDDDTLAAAALALKVLEKRLPVGMGYADAVGSLEKLSSATVENLKDGTWNSSAATLSGFDNQASDALAEMARLKVVRGNLAPR